MYLDQKTQAWFVFPRPCVSLERCFGAIVWLWLSWNGVQRTWWAMNSWLMSLINLIFIIIGILWAQEKSSKTPNGTSEFHSTPHFKLYFEPSMHPYTHAISLPPRTSCLKQGKFWVLESYSSDQHNFSYICKQASVLALNLLALHNIATRKLQYNYYIKFSYLWTKLSAFLSIPVTNDAHYYQETKHVQLTSFSC